MLSNDPGREKMVEIAASAMSEYGPLIDVPLIERIVDKLIAEDGGEDHIVLVDEQGSFTMRHPLTERFASIDGLFECPLTAHAARLAAQGAFAVNSKHRLYVGDYGIIMWDEIDPPNPGPGTFTAKQ